MDSTEASFKDRLQVSKYSRKACIAALRGQEIPNALGDAVHRLCVIRGIRYHRGFGDELRGILPIFTRALNARSIMSNVIPNLEAPNEVPYCIWHPDTASEETYRELVRRFPHLVYQVGRACAVAGYMQLYKELDILPDVHIAEEARECGNLAMFEVIMSQPVRYGIMNDYTLSTDVVHRESAYLNGDTAVRWMLDVKQKFVDATCGSFEEDGKFFPKEPFEDMGFDNRIFNITEDLHIDEDESDGTASRLLATRTEMQLLYEPLPVDLPTIQKDLLIAMAAYCGDVDRYARLRRPRSVYGEVGCCVRGIYHNTFFAVWWSKQPGQKPKQIEKAINARFIMNNVLSRAPFESYQTPYLIWWPTKAHPSTYRHLAKLQPDMLPQVIHACIYAGYKDLFDELLSHVKPDEALLNEARSKGNPYFREALEERAKSLGITPQLPSAGEGWKFHISSGFGTSDTNVVKHLSVEDIGSGFDIPYDGLQCEGSVVESMACLPDDWKLAADDERDWRELDYEDWPPSAAEEK